MKPNPRMSARSDEASWAVARAVPPVANAVDTVSGLALTPRGRLLSNEVLARLIPGPDSAPILS